MRKKWKNYKLNEINFTSVANTERVRRQIYLSKIETILTSNNASTFLFVLVR